MVAKNATKNGVWSDPTVWNGGTLPASGDDVYANTFTVDIDQNVSVNTLRNSTGTGITAGGGFTHTGAFTVTMAAAITSAFVTAALITVSGSATGAISAPSFSGGVAAGTAITFSAGFTGNVTVNGAIAGSAGIGLSHGGTGTVTVVGAVTTGLTASIYGIIHTGSGPLIVTGNVTGGGAGSAAGIYTPSSGPVTVNGNVTGGAAGSSSYGMMINGTGTKTVNGNVAAGVGAPGIGVLIASAVIVVNGNVNGAPSGSAVHTGITLNTTGCSLTVSGTAVGGVSTSPSAHGILISAASCTATVGSVVGSVTNGGSTGVRMSGASTLTVPGAITGGAGTDAYGVWYTAGSMRYGGLLQFGASGAAPIHGSSGSAPMLMRANAASLGLYGPSDDNFAAATGSPITIMRSGGTLPAAADVRLGTTYGSPVVLTGTLVVPPAGSVAAGVPVDATVGTGTINRDDLLEDLTTVIGAIVTQAATRT